MHPVPPPAAGAGAQQVTYYVYNMPAPGGASSGAPVKLDFSTCFSFYFLRSFLCFFLLGSWTILIAGTAKSQKNCNAGLMNESPFSQVYAEMLNGITTDGARDCVYFFSLLWWATWLQFVVVLAAIATTFQVLCKYRHVKAIFTTTMYFFIMSSVLLFFIANQYTYVLYLLLNKIPDASKNWKNAEYLTTVGSILCLIFNFIYIIWNSYQDVPKMPVETHAAEAVKEEVKEEVKAAEAH